MSDDRNKPISSGKLGTVFGTSSERYANTALMYDDNPRKCELATVKADSRGWPRYSPNWYSEWLTFYFGRPITVRHITIEKRGIALGY